MKDWKIPGRAGSDRFEIVASSAGSRRPRRDEDGVSPLILVVGAVALVALSLVGVFLLWRRA